MKRVLITVLVFIGFSAASFAQTAPAVKSDISKTQVEKKATAKKPDTKLSTLNKATKPAGAVTTKPTTAVKSPVTKNPVPVAKTNAATPLKKDGTPDMRYKANKKHS